MSRFLLYFSNNNKKRHAAVREVGHPHDAFESAAI